MRTLHKSTPHGCTCRLNGYVSYYLHTHSVNVTNQLMSKCFLFPSFLPDSFIPRCTWQEEERQWKEQLVSAICTSMKLNIFIAQLFCIMMQPYCSDTPSRSKSKTITTWSFLHGFQSVSPNWVDMHQLMLTRTHFHSCWKWPLYPQKIKITWFPRLLGFAHVQTAKTRYSFHHLTMNKRLTCCVLLVMCFWLGCVPMCNKLHGYK